MYGGPQEHCDEGAKHVAWNQTPVVVGYPHPARTGIRDRMPACGAQRAPCVREASHRPPCTQRESLTTVCQPPSSAFVPGNVYPQPWAIHPRDQTTHSCKAPMARVRLAWHPHFDEPAIRHWLRRAASFFGCRRHHHRCSAASSAPSCAPWQAESSPAWARAGGPGGHAERCAQCS